MDITESERIELGRRVREERERQYETKLRAYQAASLNPGTWDKIEAGAPVRADRLRVALAVLWPDLDGDWRAVLDAPSPRRGLGQGRGMMLPGTGMEGSPRLADASDHLARRRHELHAFEGLLRDVDSDAPLDDQVAELQMQIADARAALAEAEARFWRLAELQREERMRKAAQGKAPVEYVDRDDVDPDDYVLAASDADHDPEVEAWQEEP